MYERAAWTASSVHRLSRTWFPSGGIAKAATGEDAHAKLVRAGFLRQSASGIFHMLPLGRRVQAKIEYTIERHMEGALGESLHDLLWMEEEWAGRSTEGLLSSVQLLTESHWRPYQPSLYGRRAVAFPVWPRRLVVLQVRRARFGTKVVADSREKLFRFVDRRGSSYLLAPTHEEEITSLVARTVRSYREVPLRLYQISCKYRDEARPRAGLLRGREFTMKDLYTFDASISEALETYELVRETYRTIFAELQIPVLVAKASSGGMGGKLSHEYHLPTPVGEDTVVSCDHCDYVANDEIFEPAVIRAELFDPKSNSTRSWLGVTKDHKTVRVWYPGQITGPDGTRTCTDADLNMHAIKSIVPSLNTSLGCVPEPEQVEAEQTLHLFDARLPPDVCRQILQAQEHGTDEVTETEQRTNLFKIRTGDGCPSCGSGTLNVQRAIELGHTFHLGTRYSEPLGAVVSVPNHIASAEQARMEQSSKAKATSQMVPLQMGCHGIGVSRLIAAVATHLADDRGLNWPLSIAPFSCVVIPGTNEEMADAELVAKGVAHGLGAHVGPLDVVLDDRELSLPWKLNDADLIGIPIVITLGREWRKSGRVEIQCRRLGVRMLVSAGESEHCHIVNGLYDELHRLV